MSWASALFQPRAVAVVGSCSPGKIGHVLVTQLLDGGFDVVATINPKADGIRGIPAARCFQELPVGSREIDLAVIASPAATVADMLQDAGQAGVKAAVIITAGFSESGIRHEEERLVSIARQHDLRIVGPNCAGIVNTKHNLFATLETRPPAGDVAFISQSGALGGAVLSWAQEQGLGFSKFASYGNAADLSEIDFLDVLRDDDETKVVALYIETVSDGRRFMDAASRLAAVKPLIVIKSGRSESGGRATQSHTGSMAGSDAVYEAALQQCGAIRVAGIEEMFDVCRGFVHLPRFRGRRIAIVTNSGGPGVLAADAADAAGLEITPPGAALRGRLSNRLPDFCSLSNPYDLTVQATEDDYRDTLIETLKEYDAAIAINVNTPYLDAAPLARGVVAASQTTGMPIAASFVAGQPAQAALPILKEGGVPNYVTAERCVHVLSALSVHGNRLAAIEGRRSSREASERKKKPLPFPWNGRPTEPMVMDWMDELGLPTIKRVVATSAEKAVQAAQQFGGPVVMKMISPLVLHKTDVGGVVLNLGTSEDIEEAFTKLERLVPEGTFNGVLISPMVEQAVEAIVGLSTDVTFGPVIAVGLGGIYTEVFSDLALRVAPVSVEEARQMIETLRGIDLLKGARGSVLRDIASLSQLVSDISWLALRFDGIEELDLNPVFLLERGCMAADARLIPSDDVPMQRSR